MATITERLVAAASDGDEVACQRLLEQMRDQGTDVDAAPNGQVGASETCSVSRWA